MKIIRVGEYFAMSRTTGPTHNLLQVRLGSGEQGEPVCESLPPLGTCAHEALDESQLVARVLEGVREANDRLGCKHTVTHIRYVKNDSKPETVYGYLAYKIVEQVESAGGD